MSEYLMNRLENTENRSRNGRTGRKNGRTGLVNAGQRSVNVGQRRSTVDQRGKEANSQSRHKDQLLRDFILFAQPDKPFVRTDKGTVKRHATLQVYADYVESFYSSQDLGAGEVLNDDAMRRDGREQRT